MSGMCADQQSDPPAAASEQADAVPESVREALESLRVELWRDHSVRSAEREVAEQWLKHLRSRLRFAFEEWNAIHQERGAFQRELEQAQADKDGRRVTVLKPMVLDAKARDVDARRSYQHVARSVVAEMCRVREVIIAMNRTYVAQIRDLQAAIDTVDAALGLPLPPVTRAPSHPPLRGLGPSSGH
ncbi:hypothetical protein [Spirillospora sp. NPDC047279]|uniref:hypothetical protein n=1 Tax=Spirillospora sp. NPDC047279 TaxID=3155478 RepID=UPI0033ED5905